MVVAEKTFLPSKGFGDPTLVGLGALPYRLYISMKVSVLEEWVSSQPGKFIYYRVAEWSNSLIKYYMISSQPGRWLRNLESEMAGSR